MASGWWCRTSCAQAGGTNAALGRLERSDQRDATAQRWGRLLAVAETHEQERLLARCGEGPDDFGPTRRDLERLVDRLMRDAEGRCLEREPLERLSRREPLC